MEFSSGKMIEASVMQKLSEGSYEQRMTAICVALEEKSETFGGSVAVVATFPSKVVVMNENGIFYSVGYNIDNSERVNFDDIDEMSVPLITEKDVRRNAVNSFFESDDSLKEAVAGMMRDLFVKGSAPKTSLEKITESMSLLFESGNMWRRYVDDNRPVLAQIAFDPSLGSPRIETKPCFENILDGSMEGDMEGVREEVGSALSKLEGRLTRLYENTADSIENYEKVASGERDQEADQLLGRFEEFSSDYLDYLGKVGGFVSESISKNSSGCVACGALVHDEVAKRVVDLELGGRLIRKISAEFARD